MNERHEYRLLLIDEDEPDHPELEASGEYVDPNDPQLQEMIVFDNQEADACQRWGTLVEVIDGTGVFISAF